MEKVTSIKKDFSRILLDFSSERGNYFYSNFEYLISQNDLLLYSYFLRLLEVKIVDSIPNDKLIQSLFIDNTIVLEISKEIENNLTLNLFAQLLIQEAHLLISSKIYKGEELDLIRMKINSNLHYLCEKEFSLTSFGINAKAIKLASILKIFKKHSLVSEKEIALLNFNKDIELSKLGEKVYNSTYSKKESEIVKKMFSFNFDIENSIDFSKKHFLKDIDFSYEKIEYIRALIGKNKNEGLSNTNFDSLSNFEDHSDQIAEKIETAKMLAEENSSNPMAFSSDLEELIKPDEVEYNGIQKILNLLNGTFPNLKEFKKTYSRYNKKYKLYQGKRKKKNIGSIYVLLDTSGSVSEKMLSLFFGLLLKFKKLGIEIIVYECDAETKKSYKLKNREQFKINGRGGTVYNETLQEIYSKKPSLVFIMGDGLPFDRPEEKSNTVWILPKGCDYEYTKNLKIYLD